MRCRDLGFNDDFIVVDNDPAKVKEKMREHIMDKHKEEFEQLADFHKEEIMSKMDFLLKRGCGCGVLKL
ncbi:MAG: hypothetical protein JW705_05845 [Methanosarcinaceae archaeon]|nr:hypothetical protein [Methanosarcinaceae archaeon]